MVTSLRFWLISSFSAILLIYLGAAWLFTNSLNKSKTLEDYHSDLKITRILLLETNKLKEDLLIGDLSETNFYTKKFSDPEQQLELINIKTRRYIHSLKESKITKNYKLGGKLDTLKILLKEYTNNYNELVYLYKLKGFKNYGLEGRMRSYAHSIYDYNNREVKLYCLMLRKHEKDFLLRKDLNYIYEFNATIKKLIEVINDDASISTKDKNLLINDIYYYNKYFRFLARIETKIGIKGRDGYLGKSKQIFDTIAWRIEEIDNELKAIKTAHKEKLQRDTFIIGIILILFLITVIIFITQGITKSVKTISSAYSRYVNAGFSLDSITYNRSKIKEFNDIHINFLKMAKEINIFTNFFREKVHERTLAIHQQKDEILAQQLHIEHQYKTLLSRNNQLTRQKKLLAVKNNDVQQSLRYAKRIQKAIRSGSAKFKECFPESFIFFKAKDVVSGDFYLIYNNIKQQEENDKIIFIASDCTGHGVPGAIMSVLGINILNKLVNELKNRDPGKILSLLDHDMNQVLAQGKKENDIVVDGMDIAAFSFDPKTYILEYSIARFSHFFVRDSEVLNLTTQKLSIGYSFFENTTKNFETHSIQLKPGDCLYLFSDGLQDQFGGPLNKKFKKNNIKDLVSDHHALPMDEQKEVFKRHFMNWKGSYPQTDDVLVIGIRF